MIKAIKIISFFLLGIFLALTPRISFAWPTDADWIAVYRGTDTIDDLEGDAAGSRDIVGDTTTPYPAAYISNDGTYINYRIRLDDDPLNNPRTELDPFGWGFIIDTDQNADDYEWMVMLDGISEKLYLAENTVKTSVGDPSDKAEVIVSPTWPETAVLNGNYRVVTADSTFGGGTDYFLDFRLNYADFLAATGITDSTPIRYFMGSSNSAQTLASDLVAASDLYTGLSETVTPAGTQPTTGTVRFVSFANWTSDVTQVYPGDTIAIRVEDADQNSIASEAQALTVAISTPSGDSETVTLTETGADTGIFTGSIPSSGAAPSIGDGALQVEAIETVTVTYTDALDASLNENQSRTDTLIVMPSAELELTKSVSSPTPNEGDSITYFLTIINNGPSSSSGVQVYDLLPSGVTYDSDDGGGSYNSVTGTWTVPPLAVYSSAVLSIDATVNAGTAYTTITNFSNITSSGQPDPDSSNDSSSAAITVAGADLRLEKSVDNPTPNNGDTVVFTVTVTNDGLNGSTNIEVTDLLPVGLSFVSYSSSTAYNSGTGLWSVGDLAVGTGNTIKITATVTAGSGALLTNTADITATDQADPHTGDNTASASISVGGADIAVSKTVDKATPNVGEGIFYTLTVTNNGNNDASGLVVTDLLPAGVTYLSDSGGGSYNSGAGLWTVGNLANGGSAFLNISATVDAGMAGTTISNSASISALDQLDPVSGNDSSSVALTVQKADLKITKTVDNSGPNEGDTINYTLTVSNLGPHPATGVEVTDSLPSGVTYSSYSATQGSYDSGAGIWGAGSISNGTSAVLTLTATVDAGTALSTITNAASISAADQADPVSSNNSASQSISVGGADISITKSVDNPNPLEGETVYFTVTLTNNGPNDATGIAILDLEPTGLTFGSFSATDGYWHAGHNHWRVASLASGAAATMTMSATVDAGTTGQTIVNKVRVDYFDQGDYDLTNDHASAEINVGGLDLAIAKSVSDATPTIGDTVTYTLTLTNNGPADASGIKVTDNLPAGVTFNSYSATQGTFNNTSGIWSVGSVTAAASNTATLYINATVDSGMAGWAIINSAAISAVDQNDSDGANDGASASLVVQAADIAVVKSAGDSTPDEGATVTYTVTVTNNGPHNTTGLQVTDLLPAGLTFQSYSTAFGTYSSVSGLWNIGALSKLNSAILKINALVDAGTGGSNIINTASVSASDLADAISGNNSSTNTITPNLFPNLMLLKWSTVASTPSYYIPGALVNYFINLSNRGGGEAESVVVTEEIPANTEFYAGDLGGGAPIVYTETVATGLGTPVFTYSQDGSDYSYTPVPDGADGDIDNTVTNFKVTFDNASTMSGSAVAPYPAFQLQFRVRIK
ncbi:MAG: DUF11 domain-containing protein [bacterium]|nr:DUF11 domain-containing protein [bacterium]